MEDNDSHQLKTTVRDYSIVIIIALLIGLLLRAFVIESFKIPSLVMWPNLLPGDVVFIQKWEMDSISKFNLGDIVVFSSPQNPSKSFVRRVRGLPGDKIKIKSGKLYLNQKMAEFSWNGSSLCGNEIFGNRKFEICYGDSTLSEMTETVVPENHLFLISDYRHEPTSDPVWAMVKSTDIQGKAKWIGLSIAPQEAKKPLDVWNRIRWNRALMPL